jgi:hypothetical protein
MVGFLTNGRSMIHSFRAVGSGGHLLLPLLPTAEPLQPQKQPLVGSCQTFCQTFCKIHANICAKFMPKFSPNFKRTSRVVDLLMLLPFLLVVIVVHLPTFIVNLSGFFIVQIYPSLAPTLIPLLTGTGGGGGAGGGGGGGAPSNTTAAPVNPLTSAWMMWVHLTLFIGSNVILHFHWFKCNLLTVK